MAHLIDKDALVAEIDNILDYTKEHWHIGYTGAAAFAHKLKSAINTLEVKEVDLVKEANEVWNYVFSAVGWDENTLMTMTHKEFMAFAKHFFELGLKAKEK